MFIFKRCFLIEMNLKVHFFKTNIATSPLLGNIMIALPFYNSYSHGINTNCYDLCTAFGSMYFIPKEEGFVKRGATMFLTP